MRFPYLFIYFPQKHTTIIHLFSCNLTEHTSLIYLCASYNMTCCGISFRWGLRTIKLIKWTHYLKLVNALFFQCVPWIKKIQRRTQYLIYINLWSEIRIAVYSTGQNKSRIAVEKERERERANWIVFIKKLRRCVYFVLLKSKFYFCFYFTFKYLMLSLCWCPCFDFVRWSKKRIWCAMYGAVQCTGTP